MTMHIYKFEGGIAATLGVGGWLCPEYGPVLGAFGGTLGGASGTFDEATKNGLAIKGGTFGGAIGASLGSVLGNRFARSQMLFGDSNQKSSSRILGFASNTLGGVANGVSKLAGSLTNATAPVFDAVKKPVEGAAKAVEGVVSNGLGALAKPDLNTVTKPLELISNPLGNTS